MITQLVMPITDPFTRKEIVVTVVPDEGKTAEDAIQEVRDLQESMIDTKKTMDALDDTHQIDESMFQNFLDGPILPVPDIQKLEQFHKTMNQRMAEHEKRLVQDLGLHEGHVDAHRYAQGLAASKMATPRTENASQKSNLRELARKALRGISK